MFWRTSPRTVIPTQLLLLMSIIFHLPLQIQEGVTMYLSISPHATYSGIFFFSSKPTREASSQLPYRSFRTLLPSILHWGEWLVIAENHAAIMAVAHKYDNHHYLSPLHLHVFHCLLPVSLPLFQQQLKMLQGRMCRDGLT